MAPKIHQNCSKIISWKNLGSYLVTSCFLTLRFPPFFHFQAAKYDELGPRWAPSWPKLEQVRPSLNQNAPCWRQVGPCWPQFEPTWPNLAPPGCILERTWAQVNPKLVQVGGKFGQVGRKLSHVGAKCRYPPCVGCEKATPKQSHSKDNSVQIKPAWKCIDCRAKLTGANSEENQVA